MPKSAVEIYEDLRVPVGEKDIAFRPVVLNADRSKAIFVPHIRKDAAVRRLNEVLGPNWSCTFRSSNDPAMPGVFCQLSLLIGDQWISREGADYAPTPWSSQQLMPDLVLSASCDLAFITAAQLAGIGGELDGLFTDWIDLDDSLQPQQYLSLAKTRRRSQPQPIA